MVPEAALYSAPYGLRKSRHLSTVMPSFSYRLSLTEHLKTFLQNLSPFKNQLMLPAISEQSGVMQEGV